MAGEEDASTEEWTMDNGQIRRYLELLGEELQRRDLTIRLFMVGGAFMLTQGHDRDPTGDIDVIVMGIDDPPISPVYQEFKVAVRIVAMRNTIKENWLNDMVANFLPLAGDVPEGIFWQNFGTLEVYIPPHDYILALKLLAGRTKDKKDIELLSEQLGITTQEQAQQVVDRYIPDKDVQYFYEAGKKIQKFFP